MKTIDYVIVSLIVTVPLIALIYIFKIISIIG